MDFVNICRKALYFRGSLSICPACAGMILGSKHANLKINHLSRVCGDDPIIMQHLLKILVFVPRVRG